MTAILLAAGFARRFGSQKLLARIADGRYVVEAAANSLLAATGQVIAVTGADTELRRVLENCGCQVVVNSHAEEGMGTSIAAGVCAGRNAGGWLIAMGDMPFIRAATVTRVLAAMETTDGIVIPTFEGARGHPVGFAPKFGIELMALSGDEGARSVVAAHLDQLKLLAVDDQGVLADIDTTDDLGNHRS